MGASRVFLSGYNTGMAGGCEVNMEDLAWSLESSGPQEWHSGAYITAIKQM